MINKAVKKKNQIPASLENMEQWEMSRRHFVKGLLLAGAMTQIPFFTSCLNTEDDGVKLPFGQLNKKEKATLKHVQYILFPNDRNGPSCSDINAIDYLQWAIMDECMDPGEVNFIFEGIELLDEASETIYSSPFLDLTSEEKQEIIAKRAKSSRGEKWLSVNLTLIFEALLSDPQYGGNPNSIGWKWLNHNPGNPRPTEDLLYGNVFKTIVQ